MTKYRKIPVVVDACQVPPDCFLTEAFLRWCHEVRFEPHLADADAFRIATPEGDVKARPGDWIIKGVKGEFYPCKSDVFAMTYELEEE